MALGVGGLVQLLAGMWEFANGNTFGATGEFGIQLDSGAWLRPPSRRNSPRLHVRGGHSLAPHPRTLA